MSQIPTTRHIYSIAALSWSDIAVAYMLSVMQTYFTEDWGLSFTHAAQILNIWGGFCRILPLFFLFLADAYLGHFKLLVLSSSIYSVGLCLITMSTPPFFGNSIAVCSKQVEPMNCTINHATKVLLYTGLSFVAIGISGVKVSVQPFIREQTKGKPNAYKRLLPYSNYILTGILTLIGVFTSANLQPGVVSFGITSICMILATLVFMIRWTKYIKEKPQGSPLTNVCRVFVACFAKISQPLPSDPHHLHTINEQEIERHTPSIKFLERAAIVNTIPEGGIIKSNRWTLCSVGEVEDAKIALRMNPIWMTCVVCGIVYSIGLSYFMEQASHMNQNVGKLQVPPQIFIVIFLPQTAVLLEMLDIVEEEDKGNEKIKDIDNYGLANMSMLVGGMIWSVLCCIAAAGVEKRRLNVITSHGLLDEPNEKIPMSMFWLTFQFLLLGMTEYCSRKGLMNFYKQEAPVSLKNYFALFAEGVFGLGYMFGVLTVYVVGKVSETIGDESPNWFQFTLNRSRLDRYYWVLSTLAAVNFIIFMFVARRYRFVENRDKRKQELLGKMVHLIRTRRSNEVPSAGP